MTDIEMLRKIIERGYELDPQDLKRWTKTLGSLENGTHKLAHATQRVMRETYADLYAEGARNLVSSGAVEAATSPLDDSGWGPRVTVPPHRMKRSA